ncbi:fatty acid synthase [Setomelanomma holmii]|uniref:Fatty acid synthase n=1 Tax=Setomelanomma holmii TaxID=210430 RepID=A0A9P4HCG8_9PLEO|nr:fatty acid synthase [Setomelanomma holmii]
MTPTTTHPDFVSAIMKAGYHAEFAAGGYHNAETLRAALLQLRDVMPPGRSISMNVIYASPKAISWQIPFVRQLRAEGFPLTGLTIGGGVPSLEVATEYITTLGLEHISFKPSSAESIKRVLEIAKKNATFPVILQWTGGRGGGHHSSEDFHSPILETYAAIREYGNVHLVAGSGFGCAEDIIPYFTGSWSLSYGRKSVMPFDGVLFGSRVMVSAEAHTSGGAKAAIIAAGGVEDKQWSGTYRAPTGGVISVVSEMGEPIHVIATRGAQLWAELEKTIFALEKKKRPAILAARRQYLISRLNKDFQRPWFGKKAHGEACEISEMTYLEVVQRLIDLMYVGRWIDPTYETFVRQFIRRMEARLVMANADTLELRTSAHSIDVERIIALIPESCSVLMCPEDEHYFLQLCRSPGLKPVPFIPVFDDQFETFFKKDSLWQSEALETVVDQDAGRTFILHGPVAARHTNVMNEPVGAILDTINQGVLEQFRKLKSKSSLSAEESLLDAPDLYFLPDQTFARALSNPELSWAANLIGGTKIVKGGRLIQNPVRGMMRTLRFKRFDIITNAISLFEDDATPVVRLSFDGNREITMAISTNVTRSRVPIEMVFKYAYDSVASHCRIEQMIDGHNERLCNFYRELWCPEAKIDQLLDVPTVVEHEFHIQSSEVAHFKNAIGYHRDDSVPVDYAIVVSWKAISQLLVQHPMDLLSLVHLSNHYEVHELIAIDDKVLSRAKVSAIIHRDSGTELEVVCNLNRHGRPLIDIRSRFLVRGATVNSLGSYIHEKPGPFEVSLSSTTDIAVLASKHWFVLEGGNSLDDLDLTNVTLRFEPEVRITDKGQATSGQVSIIAETGRLSPIGKISHFSGQKGASIVLSYLLRHGKDMSSFTQQQDRTVHVSSFDVPESNEAYSHASGDFNPIHTSGAFAWMAGLPGTITHGMHCSAIVRRKFEDEICRGSPSRLHSYHVDFTGMVLPNETLQLSIRQVGMKTGIQQFQFEVQCEGTGEKVLKGSASVDPAPTTFCFTGQGSAAKGMGMDLYASSNAARAVWDRAETYFLSQFGLSILDIVRNNPKEAVVYFGGVRGRQLRRNYHAMHFEMPSKGPEGNREFVPMFPTIDAQSSSFTHRSPSGLLLATQFAQPALALMEMAAYADMKAAGVVAPGHQFAGHSLGEYIALACSTNFMPFESMLYLFFCRGMTMQSAVQRDATGRSDYSMVAVDPSRVGKVFVQNESALPKLVVTLRERTDLFIEIVNLNVRGKQYVCAGDLRALDLLQRICDDLKMNDYQHPEDKFTDLVTRHASTKQDGPAADVKLHRGLTTIPLTGIDVPFHSSYLRPRMEAFRSLLEDCLDSNSLAPENLIGRYIPNVTGTPFKIDRSYFETVLSITESERIQDVVRDWDSWVSKIESERSLMAVGA